MINRHYINLIWYKSIAELRAEAARAYLGFLWWIVEPIMYMVAFYIVFALIFQRGGEGFVPFLLCGLVAWKWFGSTVSQCANSITTNAGLMNQVYIPKYLFPAIVIIVGTIKFVVVLGLFLLFLFVYGISPSETWLMVPVILLIQFVLIAAVAGLVAAIVPVVPDIRLILDNVLMLFFFLSGIFFDIKDVPDEIRTVLFLNPMAVIIDSLRVSLIDNQMPDIFRLSLVLVFSVLALMFAGRLLKHYDRVYPKILV